MNDSQDERPISRRLLALETSGLYGAVAVADTTGVRHELVLHPPKRTAQALAPAIERLLSEVEWTAGSVGCIAVTIGPGSFTGLRVGVVTAKTFAYAVGATVVGVNTLETIAEGLPSDVDHATTIIDAQRDELFSATWRRADDGTWQVERPTHLVKVVDWLTQLTPDTLLAGGGLEKVLAKLPAEARVAARELWTPTASAVARLGLRRWNAGETTSVWELMPQYFRLSAAEEKAAQG